MHSLDDGWSRVRHEIKYWKVTEIEVSIIVVITSNTLTLISNAPIFNLTLYG